MLGGLSPHNHVQVAFFSERQAIPQRVIYALNPDQSLGEEIETVSRNSIVREIDVLISISVETAEALVDFLMGEIKTAKNKDNGGT